MARMPRERMIDPIDVLPHYTAALEAEHDIEMISVSLERSIELIEQKFNLCEKISQEGMIDPQTQELIRIMSNMAVAGTNYQADSFMPSMESYEGLSCSLEGQITDHFKQVGEMFSDLFNTVHAWYDSTIMATKGIEGQAAMLEAKVKELHKLGVSRLPSITVADRPLLVPGTPIPKDVQSGHDHVTSIKNLADNLTGLMTFADSYFTTLANQEKVFDDSVSKFKIFKDITGNKELTEKLFASLQRLTEDMKNIKGMQKSGNIHKESTLSPIFPGVHQIEITAPKKDTYKTDGTFKKYKMVSIARQHKVNYMTLSFKQYDQGKITFTDASLKDIEQMVAVVRHLNGLINTYAVNFLDLYKTNTYKVVSMLKNAPMLIGVGSAAIGGLSSAVVPGLPAALIAGSAVMSAGASAATLGIHIHFMHSLQILRCYIDLLFQYCRVMSRTIMPTLSETVNLTHTLLWKKGWE